jgi:hypothetical protein
MPDLVVELEPVVDRHGVIIGFVCPGGSGMWDAYLGDFAKPWKQFASCEAARRALLRRMKEE